MESYELPSPSEQNARTMQLMALAQIDERAAIQLLQKCQWNVLGSMHTHEHNKITVKIPTSPIQQQSGLKSCMKNRHKKQPSKKVSFCLSVKKSAPVVITPTTSLPTSNHSPNSINPIQPLSNVMLPLTPPVQVVSQKADDFSFYVDEDSYPIDSHACATHNHQIRNFTLNGKYVVTKRGNRTMIGVKADAMAIANIPPEWSDNCFIEINNTSNTSEVYILKTFFDLDEIIFCYKNEIKELLNKRVLVTWTAKYGYKGKITKIRAEDRKYMIHYDDDTFKWYRFCFDNTGTICNSNEIYAANNNDNQDIHIIKLIPADLDDVNLTNNENSNVEQDEHVTLHASFNFGK